MWEPHFLQVWVVWFFYSSYYRHESNALELSSVVIPLIPETDSDLGIRGFACRWQCKIRVSVLELLSSGCYNRLLHIWWL